VQVTIQDNDPRPIYQQIVDEVRRALVVGTIRPDESLPSVRELAAQLRVNPNTVAQAYRELEREGVVYVQRGRGTFVSPDHGLDEDERRALALEVARRALVDAHRNGIPLEELMSALREVSEEPPVAATPDEGEQT
jgi:GntR family transcriptional regulator